MSRETIVSSRVQKQRMKMRLKCLKKKTQRMTMTYVRCAKERRGQVQEVLQEGVGGGGGGRGAME